MFKRLLTFILAGCLIFEAIPFTAVAAVPQVNSVSGNDINEMYEDVDAISGQESISGGDSVIEKVVSGGDAADTEESVSTGDSFIEDEVLEGKNTHEEFSVEEVWVTEKENSVNLPEVYNTTGAGEDGVIALNYGTTNTLTLAGYSSQNSTANMQWYSFTAPEDGYYVFLADKLAESSYNSFFYLYKAENKNSSVRNALVNSSEVMNLRTDKLTAGDMVYLKVYTLNPTGESINLEVSKLKESSLVMQADGSYLAQTENEKFKLTVDVGFCYVKGTISLEALDGGTLEENYTFRRIIKSKGSNDESTWDFTLSASNGYQKTFNYQLGVGAKKDMQFLLFDGATGRMVSIFTDVIPLETEKTPEKVFIHSTSVTQDSIILELESIVEGYCYYAPSDGLTSQQCESFASGWNNIIFSYLQPGTEYDFEFYDANRNKLLATTVTTEANTTNIVYNAALSQDSTQLTVTADISNCITTATVAHLYYEYTNAFGEKKLEEAVTGINPVEGEKLEFQISKYVGQQAFLAGQEYDVTMWVSLGNVRFDKVVKKIAVPETMLKDEDITFVVAENGETPAEATVSFQIKDLKEEVRTTIFYRPQDDNESYKSSYSVLISDSKTHTYTFPNLQSGMTYDVVLMVDGIMKKTTITAGEPLYLLKKVGEDEINAFDFVRTFQLTGAQELEGTYYLNTYYLSNEGTYTKWGDSIVLTSDGDYKGTVKTAAKNRVLIPDTDYKFKWTISTSSDGTPICSTYETIHTAKPDLKIETTSSIFCKQVSKLTLNLDSVSNFSDFSLQLYAFIKEEGSENYKMVNPTLHAFRSGWLNQNNTSVTISGLKEKTTYEVCLADYTLENEYIHYSFTTPEDTRTITPSTLVRQFNYAYAYFQVVNIADYANYVVGYIREKGTEDAWEHADYISLSATETSKLDSLDFYSYKGEPLKEGTAYEYQVGFGPYLDTAMTELEKVVIGEFTTLDDMRTIMNATVTEGYQSAALSVDFGGNNNRLESYIHFFYREKAVADWNYIDYSYQYQSTAKCSQMINGLKMGTDYEYAIVLTDEDECSSPDEVAKEGRKLTGQFTTKSCTYTLEFALDEEELSNKTAVVAVTAKDSTADAKIQVTLTLSDEQKQTVSLEQANGYSDTVIFTNLLGLKEYTITKAVISVTENGSALIIGEISCDYKFTTKEAEVPKSITLSESEITLNAVYAGEYLEGFSSKTLTLDAWPDSASREFVWSSSDESVVTVSQDGVVYAQGAGEAVVTVASLYNANRKANCEVTVKHYAIGYSDANGMIQLLDSIDTLNIYRNSNSCEIGYYEIDKNEKPTLLSEFAVAPVKEGIVYWDNNALQALNIGNTRVDFEKDGVKAALYANVSVAGKGFGVTGFTASDDKYPALKEEDGSYTLACVEGLTYMTNGEITPKQDFNAKDFTWNISDSSVATVDEEGVITPLQAGDVTLTVVPQKFISDKPYIQECVSVAIKIKELPDKNTDTILYALANTDKTIGDVEFPESWGEGWNWKYPKTPLVTNGVYSDNSYSFEAVYSGKTDYPAETTVKVYIGKITGLTGNEIGNNHNHVLEINERDSIKLDFTTVYQGAVSGSQYEIEMPSVAGLTITETGKGTYTVAAQKSGKYTLKPVVKVGDTIIAKTTYKIIAVTKKQTASINLTSNTEGVTIDGTKVILNMDSMKDFELNAVVKDRYGNTLETALTWKISDKAVATIATASKKDTHTAKVSVKGEGHAVITVSAKDAAGYKKELDIEIRNYKPRLNTNNLTVNLAYDYEDYMGKALAGEKGTLEVVSVYGTVIDSAQILDEDGNESQYFSLIRYGNSKSFLIVPGAAVPTIGNYEVILKTTTNLGDVCEYELNILVVEEIPAVSIKMKNSINLFYTDTAVDLEVKIAGNKTYIDSISWMDESSGTKNGFVMKNSYSYDSGKYYSYVEVSQQDIQMAASKLQDEGIAEGSIYVCLKGYKKIFCFDKFKIKYVYKKPSLITKNASSNIVTDLEQNYACFNLYDKTNKQYIWYQKNVASRYSYNAISCDSDVRFNLSDNSSVYYWYEGELSGSKKITLTVDSPIWRESLQAVHTVKEVKPKAVLSESLFTFQVNEANQASTFVMLKDMVTVDFKFSNIEIRGSNAKAQKLLDEDLIIASVEGAEIQIAKSRPELMGSSIAAGTYSYKVIPYYTNPKTGQKTALNELTLKVKIVNKSLSVKISPKGSIDLARGTSHSVSSKINVVFVNPKFSNWVSGYSVSEYRLVGEYSDYFELCLNNSRENQYYITVDSDSIGKLKAGQGYKLAIEYRISTAQGAEFAVTSNTFSVKPNQSKPKITVKDNNQTMYAAADGFSREFQLSVTGDYYKIEQAYGSLDYNKDGVADIVVSGYTEVKATIIDRDAIVATTNGKTYSIPVTVKLEGRDGIAKDATVTIKVKVKR